jgi:hypothetical protein
MGGATRRRSGKLSVGVGHPVIGLDHLVFLLAAGVLFGAGRIVSSGGCCWRGCSRWQRWRDTALRVPGIVIPVKVWSHSRC